MSERRVVPRFDFRLPYPLEGSIGHSVSRSRQDDLAPVKFNEYERVMAELSSFMGELSFEIDHPSVDLALRYPETVGDAIRIIWNNVNTRLISAELPKYNWVRQSIISGRTNSTTGDPSFIYQVLPLGVQLYASEGVPLVLNISDGYDADGHAIEYRVALTSEISDYSWLNLPDNLTTYLVLSYDPDSEAIILSTTTVPPQYGSDLPDTGVSGLRFFSTTRMKSYVYDGGWGEDPGIVLGHVMTLSGSITRIVSYHQTLTGIRSDTGSIVLNPPTSVNDDKQVVVRGSLVLPDISETFRMLIGETADLRITSGGRLSLADTCMLQLEARGIDLVNASISVSVGGGRINIDNHDYTGEKIVGEVRTMGDLVAERDVIADHQVQSNAISGTPPLVVVSPTVVTNLNSDLVDGRHVSQTIPDSDGHISTSRATLSGILTLSGEIHQYLDELVRFPHGVGEPVTLMEEQTPSLCVPLSGQQYAATIYPLVYNKIGQRYGALGQFFGNGIMEKGHPSMTSLVLPTGWVASASTTLAGYNAWEAFDGIAADAVGSSWHTTAGNTSGYLQLQLPSAKTFVAYWMVSAYSVPLRAPRSWTIRGSNNGSDWTTIDTRTDITGWANSTPRVFEIQSPGSYLYYQINVTTNNGDVSYLAIGQLAYFNYVNPLAGQESHGLTPAHPCLWGSTHVGSDGTYIVTGDNDGSVSNKGYYAFNGISAPPAPGGAGLWRLEYASFLTSLTLQLPVAKTVTWYRMTSRPQWDGHPHVWTIQGSNNGTDWVVIDSRSAQQTYNSASYQRWYKVQNPGSYLYYRMVVSVIENNSGSYTGVCIVNDLRYFTGTAVGYRLPDPLYDFDIDPTAYRTIVTRYSWL